MAWKFYNPNPFYNLTGDCVVRALSLALNKTNLTRSGQSGDANEE